MENIILVRAGWQISKNDNISMKKNSGFGQLSYKAYLCVCVCEHVCASVMYSTYQWEHLFPKEENQTSFTVRLRRMCKTSGDARAGKN